MNTTFFDIDDPYGFPEEVWGEPEEQALGTLEPPAEPLVPIREHFPPAGSECEGGCSDGWEYRCVFGGSRLEHSYAMVRQFLEENGYGDLPLPADAAELKLFRRPKAGQLQLFSDQGYVHNPIKILFSRDKKQRNALILCIFNEKSPQHLLRFHGLIP
jgi:hypothetical protein